MKKVLKLKTARISPLTKPSDAEVSVPGSKSYSLRALVIAALCKERVELKNLLEGDDTQAMLDCLRSIRNGEKLNARDSGTTARFMIAICCISLGSQIITGSPGLQKRPVKDLVDALRSLGAKIEYMDKEGFLPIKVASSQLEGRHVTLSGETSSQYLSALLLIAPTLEDGLQINIKGRQISKPYIDMTIDIMHHFGVDVENEEYRQYTVKPQKYTAKRYVVESDYSSAAYFLAINKLCSSNVKIINLNTDSKQADKRFAELLEGELPEKIDGEAFPDQVMTLAVLCAFSKGKFVINGVRSLRIKESERVRAVENELAKMGIRTESTQDSLTIYGGSPSAARIETYGDHRIAMAFAVAGARLPGMEIINPDVVKKTFPGFWDELGKVTYITQGEKEYSNILLIGMRGSGKTTVGKILADKLGKKFIDMDIYLQEKQGRTIRDIVLEEGWDHFRKLEKEACEQISKETDAVISSGGGIVLDQANMELFEKNSARLLLKADPAVLSTRIRKDANRPELTTQPTLLGELDDVWQKRQDKYYKNADFIIDTSADSPDDIVDEIMEKLK